MFYVAIESDERYTDLQWVLSRYGIELQPRMTYYRAIVFDWVDDPAFLVAEILDEQQLVAVVYNE